MSIPRIPTSRWFMVGSTGLLVFLCLAVLVAGLILMRRSAEPRVGQIGGSSMEPTLMGPRIQLPCSGCGFENRFTADAWDINRPVACMCCKLPLPIPDPPTLLEGERIRFLPARWISRAPVSAADSGTTSQGDIRQGDIRQGDIRQGDIRRGDIRRGDVVVVERAPEGPREVKRVAGLPGESVLLSGGDVWINGKRHQKSASEALRQAVLVGHWNRQVDEVSLGEFFESFSVPIRNDLPINAHDSHVLVPIDDFGIAMQIYDASEQWVLDLTLQSPARSLRLEIDGGAAIRCRLNGTPLPSLAGAARPGKGPRPVWLVVAQIDDRLLVADETGTSLAAPTPLPPLAESEINKPMHRSPCEMRIVSGSLVFDRALLFRDIVYRGYGDVDEQTIEADEGYVVLGDNVSISDDSRGVGKASTRIPSQAIRGVVLQDRVSLGSLLRQAETMPPANGPACHAEPP